jgi:hypothetical protein
LRFEALLHEVRDHAFGLDFFPKPAHQAGLRLFARGHLDHADSTFVAVAPDDVDLLPAGRARGGAGSAGICAVTFVGAFRTIHGCPDNPVSETQRQVDLFRSGR